MNKENPFLRYDILMIGILLAGIGLRLYGLGTESLWLDEAATTIRAQYDLDRLFGILKFVGGNPPLHTLIIHYWIKLFGASEISVRLPSVIFSVISILMTYKIAALLFDKKTAMIGALLIALSSYHVYYAQEARPYALMAMLSLFSMYYFIKLLTRPNALLAVGYLLSCSLLLYTHYYGGFIILAQNIYLGSMWLLTSDYRLRWKRWFLLQGILGASFLPWLHILIRKTIQIQSGKLPIPEPWISDIIQSLKLFSGSNTLIGLLFPLLALGSLVIVSRRQGTLERKNFFTSLNRCRWEFRCIDSSQTYLLGLWFLVPIAVAFILSKVSTPIFGSRYIIASSIAFYILIAKGLVNLNQKHITILTLAVILLLYPLKNIYNYRQVNKEPWREAVGLVEKNARTDDLILIHAFYCLDYPYTYYAQRSDLTIKTFPSDTLAINQENIKDLPPLIRNHNRIWVIMSHKATNHEWINDTLEETFRLAAHHQFLDIDVYLYEKLDKKK